MPIGKNSLPNSQSRTLCPGLGHCEFYFRESGHFCPGILRCLEMSGGKHLSNSSASPTPPSVLLMKLTSPYDVVTSHPAEHRPETQNKKSRRMRPTVTEKTRQQTPAGLLSFEKRTSLRSFTFPPTVADEADGTDAEKD